MTDVTHTEESQTKKKPATLSEAARLLPPERRRGFASTVRLIRVFILRRSTKTHILPMYDEALIVHMPEDAWKLERMSYDTLALKPSIWEGVDLRTEQKTC